jgi:hypothetical protein
MICKTLHRNLKIEYHDPHKTPRMKSNATRRLAVSIYFFLKNEVIFGMVRMTWFNLIPYLFNEDCLFSNSWFEHAIVKALSFSTKNICCISRFTQIMHTQKMHESTCSSEDWSTFSMLQQLALNSAQNDKSQKYICILN